MASAGDRYLPELARCFAGEATVFSWAETYQSLNQDLTKLNPHLLNTLISSPKIKSILSQKVPCFSPPSPQSRSQYESKTTAISIPTSTGGGYDIDEIKSNTLWLSGEVKLAEDEALHLTILEWQRRPAETLLSGYSDAEIASLQDALGKQDDGGAQGLKRLFTKRTDHKLDDSTQKRMRLLNVYFQEQLGLIGVGRRLQELILLKDDESTCPSNLMSFAQELNPTACSNAGVVEITNVVESRLQELEAGRSWSISNDILNEVWMASEIQYILTLLEISLFRIRSSTDTVDTEIILRWLQLMAGCEFFMSVQPGPLLEQSQVEYLQAMAALTTLAMLDPATAFGTLTDASSVNPFAYFLNSDAAHDLHRILLSAAEACIPQASPAALAWALILGEIKRQGSIAKEARESGAVQRAIDQVATFDTATGRRASTGSLQQSIYEEVVSTIMNTSDISDPVTYLLRCTVEAAHVFDTVSILARDRDYRSPLLGAISLQILQELLSVAVSAIGYTPEILSAQFSILATTSNPYTGLPDAREIFVKNHFLMDNIFAVAASRFPYEALPFLQLCKLLTPAKIFDDHGTQYITFRLRAMDNYTQSATGLFASYRTVREDENLNLVALDNAVNMLAVSQTKLITHGRSNTAISMVPADTIGEVISESIPPIIRWQHSYSALALLGMWLELHYLGQLHSVLSPYESSEDIVTEIIGIFTGLLQHTIDEHSSRTSEEERQQLQAELLDDFSSMLSADATIIDYVFEILEQELQAYRRRPSNVFNTTILVACIDCVAVISKVRPEEFWPLFSKSSLMESYGSANFLLSIISGVEVPNQSFLFLKSCTRLFDCVIQAIFQRSQPVKPTSRSIRPRRIQPQNLRLYANVLSSITQALYSAFDSIPGWTFSSMRQQATIVTSLAQSFKRIILYANAVQPSRSSLVSCFAPASDFLVQQLQSGSDDLSSTTSVLRHLFRAEDILQSQGSIPNSHEFNHALHDLLSLSIVLVRLGQSRLDSPSILDQQLFNALPLLCHYVARSEDRHSFLLIRNLLTSIARTSPVSLLGHLGSTSAMNLLEVLQLKLYETTDDTTKSCIWDLLSGLVGRNQQWLAIVILTGSPPDKNHREIQADSRELRGKTFLEIALKQLATNVKPEPLVITSILKFIIHAQMNWSWANEAIKNNKDFLPSVLTYVCDTYVDASDEVRISYRNMIASLVTDLCTIHLHHAKARRDTTTLKVIVPLLSWLSANAIAVTSYKHSLHSNLRKNFANKFDGFELNNFKRTEVVESRYGDQYYYDLAFAHKVLKDDQQWDGNGLLRDRSFSAELRRANLNLSVVDSEVRLLNSFANLCVEHSGYFAQDAETQKTVVEIVKNALDANTQVYPPEKLFDNVLQVRADLAISLLQRLVDARAKGPDVRALLKHAWECARSNNGSFEQAILDNGLIYWRSMLTIILMTLQFQVDKRYMPPAADQSPGALLRHTEAATTTILEIVSIVIGQGFRSVAAALQGQRQTGSATVETSVSTVTPKDVYLILTIFETILRMTRLPEFISEASQRLIAEGAIQSCLLLYSWSHVLTSPEFDDEPVFAGYCLRFLASLSSLPPVTEELAVEGVLSRLLSARITQKLQAVPDGAAHVDKRPHTQTLYNLWATGLLPICLNLLHSVGAPIAAEVSIFLNQFTDQLGIASAAFIQSQSRSANAYAITSIVAEETTTLALISYILNSFRNAGASAAVDPSTILPLARYDEHKKALSEDITDIVNSTTASLKTRIVPTNEKELSLSREGNGEGLVNKVVTELRNALTCLKGEESEDDK